MQCPECGYGYAPHDPGDQRRHGRFHDRSLEGAPAPPIDAAHIIWRGEDPTLEMIVNDDIPNDRVMLLTPRSPAKIRRVAGEVARMANLETDFSGGVYSEHEPPDPQRDRHVFLYEQYGRFVGLVIFDRRTWVIQLTWEEYDHQDKAWPWRATAPFWAISFAWVHQRHRRKGLATRLASVAADHLGAHLDHLGVSPPLSDSAEALARNLFPGGVRFAR